MSQGELRSGCLTCFDLKGQIKLSQSISPQWKVLQLHCSCRATATHVTELRQGPILGPTQYYSKLLCL